MATGASLSSSVVRTQIDERPAWIVQTERAAIVLSLNPDDVLLLDHWGGRGGAARRDDYLPQAVGNRQSLRSFLDGVPLAYPVYGDPSFKEPCLCAVYEDGTRAVRLGFREERVVEADGQPALELDFVDAGYGLVVTHRFVVYPEHDVVARGVRLENVSDRPILIERALSAGLALPPARYDAWTLHGQWGREFQLQRRSLLPGKFVTESRSGITGHESHPWFAVTPAGETDEKEGRVWFGALAWSGSFVLSFEVERNDALSIVAGIQPFDFAWWLGPGERFETPELVCGYTDEGLGGASRLLHRYEADRVLPERHRQTLRPVLYNSWYATEFDVRADQQIELARRAARLGVELFVVDDGWFGTRDNDRAGLGDWVVDRRKFPNGLEELTDEVHRLGMRFGIWVEPEMVNPDSDLYRAHPDWVFRFEGRDPILGRNQLVLNFARGEVRANVLDQLRRLLREHAIHFVKWDHNRPLTDVGWAAAGPERQREAWVRHVRGVHEVIAALRAEFPDLLIESCAGGGGRADLGILRLTDQVWVSDNTDAADRLAIQYGYSRAHAPRTMVNWVTDGPNGQTGRESPLAFRFHVAMQGVLGVGGDLVRWTDAELAQARELVDRYKRLRPIVQHGVQYWLAPPAPIGSCAVQYVSASRRQCALFLYQVRGVLGEGARRVRLCGLDPELSYRRDTDGAESTGAALMAAGVPIDLGGWRDHAPGADWRSDVQLWEGLDRRTRRSGRAVERVGGDRAERVLGRGT